MKRRLLGAALLGLSAAVLVACGGGGGSPAASSITVTPAKGAIYAADVTVYQANGTTTAGTSTTAAKTATGAGTSSVSIGSYSGITIVQVKGNANATYFDESSTSADKAFGTSAVLVSAVPSGATTAGVTPLTSMAARLSGIDTAALGTAGAVPSGFSADTITEGGARLVLALGLPPDFNIFAVPTVIKTTADIATADANAALIAKIGAAAGGGDALAYSKTLIDATPKATVGTDGKTSITGAQGTAFGAAFATFKTTLDSQAAALGVTTRTGNFDPTPAQLTTAVTSLKAAISAGTAPKASGSGSGTGSGSGSGSGSGVGMGG